MHEQAMQQLGREMMQHGAGAMSHGAGMVNHGAGMGLGAGLAKGAVMVGTTSIFRSPLVMFLLGAAAGVAIYKYRKEIVAYAAQAGDRGRDFVLQQKESLNDLLEEAREEEAAAETPAGTSGPGA